MLSIDVARPPDPHSLREKKNDFAQNIETTGALEYAQSWPETPLDGSLPRL
jgi:hypothetical protein